MGIVGIVGIVSMAYGKRSTYLQRPTPPTPQLLLVPRRVGNYLVAVTLNGEPILGSRFALSVGGDGAHPGSCVAAGTGLRCMVAGELGRFTVQAWDAYGNIVRRRIFEPGGGAGPAACVQGVARALLSSPFPSTFASPNSPPLTPPPPPPRRRRRRSRKTSRCVYGRSRSPAAARVASPASGRPCARGAGPTTSLTPRPSLCPSPPRH